MKDTILTRKTVAMILKNIEEEIFNKFKESPEEFISKISEKINDIKAQLVINNITYQKIDISYSKDIFNDLDDINIDETRVYKASKHLADYVIVDSNIEKDFAIDMDRDEDIAFYIKLPTKFKISTPIGNYSPDWAIAFYKGTVKHVYFVAETKGTGDISQLRPIEQAKIKCAKKHFEAISNGEVVFDFFNNYKDLKNKLLS